MLRRLWLAAAVAFAAALGGASAAQALCTSGIVIDSACVIVGDLRGALQIPAATLNTMAIGVNAVGVDGARGSLGAQISGLTASGATLTPVWTDDGVTWNAGTAFSAGVPVTTLTTDGAVSMDAAHHVAVGFKVTVAGTGTITATYTATASSIDVTLRNAMGNQTDAAWPGTGNGSMEAVLKALWAALGTAPAGVTVPPLSLVAATDTPLSGTGFSVPGRVCLSNASFALNGSGNVTTTPNLTPIAVNWSGGSALTSPAIVLAPGQEDVCKFIASSNAPHVAAPAAISVLIQQ